MSNCASHKLRAGNKRVRFAESQIFPTVPQRAENDDITAELTTVNTEHQLHKRRKLRVDRIQCPPPLVTVAEYLPNCAEITCAEKSTRWLTNEDRAEIIRSIFRQAHIANSDEKLQFQDTYSELYEFCHHITGSDDAHDDNDWLFSALFQRSNELARLVYYYDGWRGIEDKSSMVVCVQRHLARKQFIRTVLSVVNNQKEIPAVSDTGNATDTASRVSEALSLPARRLARFLACVDALASEKAKTKFDHTIQREETADLECATPTCIEPASTPLSLTAVA
jgi:hypothetical protein